MVTEENCLWIIEHVQILVYESKRGTVEVKYAEELLKLKVSKFDPGLFIYQYKGTLHGLLLVTHVVDDFSWAGSHVFLENVKPKKVILEVSGKER